MALVMPVSSSRLRNTNPFAVPGRCRAITAPAIRTVASIAQMVKVSGRSHTFFHLWPFISHRMKSNGHSRTPEIRHQPLLGIHGRQGRLSLADIVRATSQTADPLGFAARSICHDASLRWMPGPCPAMKFKLRFPLTLPIRISALPESAALNPLPTKTPEPPVLHDLQSNLLPQSLCISQPQAQTKSPFVFFEHANPSEQVTSIGLIFKPCLCASLTMVAGW